MRTALVALLAAVSIALGADRSSQWGALRDRYIEQHPVCAACQRPATCVHHILPFHVRHDLELCETNLLSFCDRHHFEVGHLEDWTSWNTNAAADAASWKVKLSERPHTNTTENDHEADENTDRGRQPREVPPATRKR